VRRIWELGNVVLQGQNDWEKRALSDWEKQGL
jgi:hypothetical protein